MTRRPLLPAFALASLLTGCSALATYERYEPTLEESGGPTPLVTERHESLGPGSGARWVLAGSDAGLELRGGALALDLAATQRVTTAWSAGPILPVLPLFWLDGDPPAAALALTLRGLAGCAPHDLLSARLYVAGEAPLEPSRWSPSSLPAYEAVPWEREASVGIAGGETRTLTWPVTPSDLDAFAVELELRPVGGGPATRARVGFERSSALCLVFVTP